MNTLLDHICQPLLQYLSTQKLIKFTSCNKFLYNISEPYLKDKCQQSYDVEYFKISWRYTLSLLKNGYKKIPIIINLCENNKVSLRCNYYTKIYANCNKYTPHSFDYMHESINKYHDEYIYQGCYIDNILDFDSDSKYYGLSFRKSDGKTLFESIISINIFMKKY